MRDALERSEAIAYLRKFLGAGASEAGGAEPISSLTAIQGCAIQMAARNGISFLFRRLLGGFFYFS
ncbi:MAG: hypothetical protein JNM89_09885 [Hyphomicrobiaceae bacterium]|nr:hypothetical protein [Hyphomicrobiaceae bacterium]